VTLLSTAAWPGERKCDESSDDELPSPRKILGARLLEVFGLTGDELSNLPQPGQNWVH
jgi:hypothetical protein